MKYDNLLPDQKLAVIRMQRIMEHNYKLHQYSEMQLAKIKKSLSAAYETLLSERVMIPALKGKTRTAWSKERLNKVLSEIETMALPLKDLAKEEITNLALASAELGIDAYSKILSFDGKVKNFNNVSLSPSQLRSMITDVPVGGHTLNDWVNRTFGNKLNKLQDDILTGRLAGEGYRPIVKRLREDFGNVANSELITLARSYVQEANVRAMESVYQANRHIVKGVKWCATLEAGFSSSGRGTCPRCAGLDGNVYDLPSDDIAPQKPKTGKRAAKKRVLPKKDDSEIELRSSKNAYYKQIVDRKTERAIVLDQRGNKIFDRIGDDNSVAFSSAERASFYGTHFLHNHPNGSSFSPSDFAFSLTAGVESMEAVGLRGVFHFEIADDFRKRYFPKNKAALKPSDALMDKVKEVVDRKQAIGQEIFLKWNPLVMSGKMPMDKANFYHHHVVNILLAREFPDVLRNYRFTKW